MASSADGITGDDTNDSSPLLATQNDGVPTGSVVSASPPVVRRSGISRALRLLRRRSSRRLMRESSVLVRETAAEQLEERQNAWAYSRPVVILDLIWNLAFIVVSVAILILSIHERPSNPLRLWILGYAAQCGIHMACVWTEYHRRYHRDNHEFGSRSDRYSFNASTVSSNITNVSHPERPQMERGNQDGDQPFEEVLSSSVSTAKRIESINTSFSFVWWVVGFYWTTTGSQSHDAPLLFWLSVAFLAFDVFFVVFCVSLVCIIGMAVCCCLPCIIAIMYAVTEQKGASEEDINVLPKYKYRSTRSSHKANEETSTTSGGVLHIVSATAPPSVERVLSSEDAECCICLSSYDDGVEIRELPCSHHFHCSCVDRWLRMNSTCPLCKYNMAKAGTSRREDV